MKKDTGKVVPVMSFDSVMEAQIYKALLESAGVVARMQNDIAAQVLPAYGALMEVRLLVAEEDLEKARNILKAGFDIDEFRRESATAKEPAETRATKKATVKNG